MRAQDIHTYLQSLNGGWVGADTVDTFKAGDPAQEITGIAVGWMSYLASLQRAVELGCNLFITHEPTYYNHFDADEKIFRFPVAADKRQYIAENKLVVLRCHDLWDKMPEIGITDTWARLLGFSNPVAGEGYYRVFEVVERTAMEVAEEVARSTRGLGQDAVQLLGPAEVRVKRIALGTGAATPLMHLLETYAPDMVICTDDGFTYWRDGALAIDLGFPVAVVNHLTSEVSGVQMLAQHLRERFPEVPVHYIPQSCMYRLCTGPRK